MAHYIVTWVIDIEADSAEEAAKQALDIQRDECSEATFFQVEHCATGDQFTVDMFYDTVEKA